MKNHSLICTLLIATLASSPAAAVGVNAKVGAANFSKATVKPSTPNPTKSLGNVANVVNSGVKGLKNAVPVRKPGFPRKQFDPNNANVDTLSNNFAGKQPIPPVRPIRPAPTPSSASAKSFGTTATPIGDPLHPCTLTAAGAGCPSDRTPPDTGNGDDLTEVLQSGNQGTPDGGNSNPDNLFAGDIPTAGLSPEQLGALAPAAGGAITAENEGVACMNAYLQNGWDSAEMQQKCAGGAAADGNQAI